jgi:hypothetical protein
MKKIGPAVAAIAVVLATIAYASPADVRASCAEDIKTQCRPGALSDAAFLDCIARYRREISPYCKIAVADELLEERAKAASPKPVNAAVNKAH